MINPINSIQDISDPRLLNLSYSSLLKLHECPRKYQLYKLNTTPDSEHDPETKVTFAFGHVVGLGIQLHFCGASEDEIIFALYQFWSPALFESNDKQKKSFFLAVAAIQNFISLRQHGFLKEWEVVEYNGNYATELAFVIILPNGYRYRGSVDAVLQNKNDGTVMVLEVKTSSSTNLNPANYKNSSQAIGYSVVLDNLFPGISSYQVLYLVYLTKSLKYETLVFNKSYLQRALWIQELLLDCEMISLYDSTGVYPMHGESCVSFFRDCEYLNTCTLATKYLTKELTDEDRDRIAKEESRYTIEVSLLDLIQTQVTR